MRKAIEHFYQCFYDCKPILLVKKEYSQPEIIKLSNGKDGKERRINQREFKNIIQIIKPKDIHLLEIFKEIAYHNTSYSNIKIMYSNKEWAPNKIRGNHLPSIQYLDRMIKKYAKISGIKDYYNISLNNLKKSRIKDDSSN